MNRALRSLYLTVILFSSCGQPTEYITEYETQYIEVPVVETVCEYVDNIIEVEKEIYIMSNETAITVYDNYVTTDSKVYGISDGNFIEIENVTGLYKNDSVLYFNLEVTSTTTVTDDGGNESEETTTSINAYSQTDGVLTALDELPTEPDSEYTEFESGTFKIENAVSGDLDCSFVYNGTDMVSYLQVDGVCMMDSDLLFSVSTTYATRYKGIYKYEADDGCPRMKFSSGRIW